MISLNLRVKTQLKDDLAHLIEYAHRKDYSMALGAVLSLENHVAQYHLSRGISCEESVTIIRSLKYWLVNPCRSDARFKEVRRLVLELHKILVPELPGDPFDALKRIYWEIQDDFVAWRGSRSPGDWDAIRDDFERVRQLEPKFRAIALPNKDAIYQRYREILQAMGACIGSLPSEVPTDKMWTTLQTSFRELFSLIESLFAHENLKIEGGKVTTVVGITAGREE